MAYGNVYLYCKKDISVLKFKLSKDIDIRQATTWFMLHRLCEVICNDNDMLSGTSEIDKSYISGKEPNKYVNKKFKNTKAVVDIVNRDEKK